MPIVPGPDPRRNRLLAALPREEYERLEGHLGFVTFAARQSVYEPDERLVTVYFPLTGVLAFVKVLRGGESVDVANVGHEGFVGHVLLFGVERMSSQVLCKIPSTCATMRADAFRPHVKPDTVFHSLVLRYTKALLDEVFQTAACNRIHSVQQRLARCLLQTHDRVGAAELPMTHDFISELLGVRRASVTVAIAALQLEGAIRAVPGRITIVDRPRLQAAACECYDVLKEEYDRVSASAPGG